MCDSDIVMYLAPAPVETGQDTPCKAYNVLKSMRKTSEGNNMYYCFWGVLDFQTRSKTIYDSMGPEEQSVWVKLDDNTYARKETNFTVVPGYEDVKFSEARDKSLYHPGSSSSPYKDINIETDDGKGEPMPQPVQQRQGKRREVIIGDVQQGRCINTNKDSFILYCTPDPFNYIFKSDNGSGTVTKTEKQYLFQLIDVPVDSMIPWTYTNRMGVFRADYGKFGANSYTLSVIEGGTRGIVWGMGENTSFIRQDVEYVVKP